MHEEQSPLILIVDDDPMMRFLARETLEPRGFRIAEAENGAECLTLATELRPDLILLDVQMPVLDGFTTCSRLRVLPHCQNTPVLMMTGLDDVGSIQHAYQVGATDFVTKPLNFALLEFRLYYMLRAKGVADQLRSNEALLETAQRIARLGHWEYAPTLGFTRWSRHTDEVLGLPPETTVGSVDALLDYVVPDDRALVRAAFQDCLTRADDAPIEYTVTDCAGVPRIIQQFMQRQAQQDGTVSIIGTVQDITERRRAEQQIHDLAFYDGVTGLPNRTLLEQHLVDVLAAAPGQGLELALLTLNLDHFQRFNEHFGHLVGNELLHAMGRRLTTAIRRDGGSRGHLMDMLARSAGDEFCLVVAHPDARQAGMQIARRVHDVVRTPFAIKGEQFTVTVSIGLAVADATAQSPEALIRHANLAVNHAKRQGRDHTEAYSPEMETRAEQRLSLETKLRQAIGTDQISLHYQPKLRASTLELTGMEALVRWEHPELGRVSPADFIPIAEETGLILPLGEWILHEACRQVVAWSRLGFTGLVCAVNLSAAQFRDHGLPQRIAQILRDTGAEPAQLQLELTESLVMQDETLGLAMLGQLKALGISLAIDDFGTGYSSLSYLKRLPVDIVKIDQSFVRELSEESDDAAIVEAVIALAHSLRLEVIAEGVEQGPQLEFLRRLGCDEVQGYLLGKPMPGATFTDWLVDAQAAAPRLRAAAGT
ncbi:MAG: putative bifunctional diguanylate cyclase/phosphodiesterase [Gammaproteobacteria bacterium]